MDHGYGPLNSKCQLVFNICQNCQDMFRLKRPQTEVLCQMCCQSPPSWSYSRLLSRLRLFHWLQEHRQGLGDGLGARPAGGAAEEGGQAAMPTESAALPPRSWCLGRKRHGETVGCREVKNSEEPAAKTKQEGGFSDFHVVCTSIRQ